MIHGSPTVSGQPGIEEYWAADFEEGNPLTLLDVTNSVMGSDMMLVHGDYRVIDRDTGAQLGSGRFAHLWTLADGRQWKLDRDLWNHPYEPYEATNASTDVQALASRWADAYNRHDRAALTALYAPSARLMMHGAPPSSAGGISAISGRRTSSKATR